MPWKKNLNEDGLGSWILAAASTERRVTRHRQPEKWRDTAVFGGHADGFLVEARIAAHGH